MKLLLTGAVLLAAVTSHAQMNRVSAGINTLNIRNISTKLPGQSTSTDDRMGLLPSVGYYRTLGRSLGIGIELGYGEVRETTNATQSGAIFSYSEQRTLKFQEYYICPAVLETFNSQNRKYKFIASLTVPIGIIPEIEERAATSGTAGPLQFRSEVTEPDGSMFRLGLFVNGAVQRKLIGGLYAGVQLGTGGIYSRKTVKGTQVSTASYGMQPQRTETKIDNTETNYRFELRPMLSLNYYF